MILGSGGEEGIGTGVEGRLDGILNHSDDETDSYGLHSYIGRDAEERAGHRHQEKRTACHTRSATGTERRNQAKEEGRGKGGL